MRDSVILLLMISMFHFGYGDKPYKVIHFTIPHEIWEKALRPTPVLKSPVTITLPINVHDDSNEVEDPIEDEVPENSQETVINNDEVTEIVQDPAPVTNNPEIPAVTQSPALGDAGVSALPQVPGQLIRFPCNCRGRQCECCTGALLQRINMKACSSMEFIPEDFVFDVKMKINDRTVVRRRVSASDPPPICFNPGRAPFLQVCAEISNIQIRNRNAHACLDINADVGGFPVYSASFRCFNFGASGLQTGKKPRPVSSPGPKPVNLFGNSNDDNSGGFLENTAGAIFGEGGIFQGGGSSNDEGPFGGIGDTLGDFLDLE